MVTAHRSAAVRLKWTESREIGPQKQAAGKLSGASLSVPIVGLIISAVIVGQHFATFALLLLSINCIFAVNVLLNHLRENYRHFDPLPLSASPCVTWEEGHSLG